MLLGYARVSTVDQNIDLQLSALREVGCEQLYQDQISGTKIKLKPSNDYQNNVGILE